MFSSVILSSLSLGVECCVFIVVVLGCVSCCCGSSIGWCGGSVCKCMCVVPGSGGVWASGGAVVTSRCFLWWSKVSLCASCMVASGAGLFCGVGGPLFVGGCLGLGLWRFPLVNGLGVISGEVLGLCVQVAIGRQVASISRRGCLGSRRVHPSSRLRIPNGMSNGLAVGVVLGSGAG